MLLVEDDSTTAGALASILRLKGCEVYTAGTLGDARTLWSRLAPAPRFVVLDLMLPDGDGEDLLRLMRQGSATSVIVTTAVADEQRLDDVRALTPLRVLRKPIELVDLLGAMGMM